MSRVPVFMNKNIITLAALPAIFAAVGFGAGKLLEPAPATAAAPVQKAAHDDAPDARDALHKLAEDQPAAHGDHDDSLATPKPMKGTEHEAKLIPASATAPDHGKAKPAAKDHAAQDTKAAATGHGAQPTGDRGSAKTPQAVLSAARQAQMNIEYGEPGSGVMTEKQVKDSKVIKLGRMTVPVQNAQSISYVVTDVGVAVTDIDAAAHFNVAENATRLRDAILLSMHRIAGTSVLRGDEIDPRELSDSLSSDMKTEFGEKVVDEVLFLSLYKADVPRS